MLDNDAAEMAALAIALFTKLPERPTSEDIRRRLKRMNTEYGLAEAVLESVIAEIETSIFTSMPLGTAVLGRGTHSKWLARRRPEITFAFWNRYVKFLQYDRNIPTSVIKTLDTTLDDLLELLGDPHDHAPFLRRGLVVGDVQSGKTATYIGLCSKAADAGYKIVIILAGHINSLRDQTQDRLDEGFAGRDSKLVGKLGGESTPYGAAKYDRDLFVHEYTTKLHDFDTQAAQSAGSPLGGLKGPALLVVKKNKTILQNLFLWLKSLNPIKEGKIGSSLLLIDDEADFASVNTGNEYDPRAINKGIRQLLDLFDNASYVGVTATPFANVFISPETKHDVYGEDLFPEDYIYSLEPPSNYVGPVQVFEEDLLEIVRTIDDIEHYIPLKHNRTHVVHELPPTLLRAIYAFYLTNAIRDLRLEGPTDRTMLVNVSPLNAIQAQVADLIRDHAQRLAQEVMVFSNLPPEEARDQSGLICALEDVFASEFAHTCADQHITWPSLIRRLHDANKQVQVSAVNMTSKSQLNYEQHKGVGLRVIAVGGHSLSRGLTLEGLCVSYFHRNSTAYDTLLQMGRWFGYRPHYRDLCRVYLTEQAVANYRFVTDATQELKAQFARMRQRGATPLDFGLKVRASPAGLMMTAAAKMKTAKKVMHGMVSLSTRQLEAIELPTDEETLKSNEIAVARLVSQLGDPEPPTNGNETITLWRSQPKALVVSLLEQYRVHPRFLAFRPSYIADYLHSSDASELQLWDICVRGGKEQLETVHGLSVTPSRRKLVQSTEDRTQFTIGEAASRRLGSGGDELIGLSQSERAQVEAHVEKLKHEARKYRISSIVNETRKRPILILYFVKAAADPNAYIPPVNPFTAISLNFPEFKDEDLPEQEIYFANQTWQKYEESLRADLDEDDARMNQVS